MKEESKVNCQSELPDVDPGCNEVIVVGCGRIPQIAASLIGPQATITAPQDISRAGESASKAVRELSNVLNDLPKRPLEKPRSKYHK